MYTIIISEKSPVCTSERSCENARMYDFVEKSMHRNFGKFIKQSDPIILSEYTETTHPKSRPKTTQLKLPTAGTLWLMNVLHPLSSVKAVTDV